MNKRQKLVQQQFLNNEKEVIRLLRLTYGQSLKDVNEKIKNLDISINDMQATVDMWDSFSGTPEEKAKLQSMIQSKIYQKQYQQAIQGQIDDVMKKLHKNAYSGIDDYLNDCYSEGFIGAVFDLHGQNIPLIMPIDQEAVVRAVQLDSKISKGLYFHMGESVNGLKKTIANEVSRGMVNGSTYAQIAQQISFKMVGTYQNPGGALSYAMRIARTEGHRIQVQAGMDACYKAKDMGADVLKQWDATLDGVTRKSHKKVDTEIRELDEPFSNGLMFPGDPGGGAAEVVNCRCALLERARWALDEEELQTLKDRAEFFELDKTENFEDFKKKYLKAVEKESEVKEIKNALDFEYGDLTQNDYNKWWDDYEAHNRGVNLSAEELKIIDDYTEGSFISLNDVSRFSDSELLKKGYSAEDIARIRKKADILDGALSKYDLDTDIVTHRFERDITWLTGNGNGVDELEKLIGKEYTAKGFTSSGMLPNRFRFTGGKKDAVHFEIITPKGTNGAFLSMSKKGENEFLYNRNTRFKILDGGERIVKEGKLNIRTMQMEEVEITERFLKVQVIVDDVAEEAVENIVKAEKLNVSNFPSSFMARSEKKNTEKLVEYVNSIDDANPDTIKLYNSMGKLDTIESKGIPFKIAHSKNHAVSTASRYTGELVEVKLNIPKLSGDNLAGQVNITLHEEMHLIDLYCRTADGKWYSSSRKELVDAFKSAKPTMSDEVAELFKKHNDEYKTTSAAIRKSYKDKISDLTTSYYPDGKVSIWSDLKKYDQHEKEVKKLQKEMTEVIDYECRNSMNGVNALQDIYDAISGGQFRDSGVVTYGHGSKYYRYTDERVQETIANYGALSVLRPDLVDMLRADKPELVEALEETVKSMLEMVGE